MHPVWGPYPDTLLRFPGAGLVVDLRAAVTPAIAADLARLGLGSEFSVVTACNPRGRLLEADSNQRLGAVLAAVVTRRWPGARPAWGESPDGDHREPGWAIPAPIEVTRDLAAGFFQDGLFRYDGRDFFIVPVLAGGPLVRLPVRE